MEENMMEYIRPTYVEEPIIISEHTKRLVETRKRVARLKKLTGKTYRFTEIYNSAYGEIDPIPEYYPKKDKVMFGMQKDILAAEKKAKIKIDEADCE